MQRQISRSLEFLSSHHFANIISALALVVSAFAFFKRTDADVNFDGLRIQAEVQTDGRLEIRLPASYPSGPESVTLTGSLIHKTNIARLPVIFQDVPIGFIGERYEGNYRFVEYEDIRPAVCSTLRQTSDCGDYIIDGIRATAHFPRGPKPANIYENNILDLF